MPVWGAAMRGARGWAGAWFICLASMTLALARDDNPPAISDQRAGQYALDLRLFITQVQAQYVREVPEVELYLAAFSGLHEAAGKPLQAKLREQLTALVKERENDGRENEYHKFLTKVRKEIGDVPALRDSRDLISSIEALSRVLDPYCGIVKDRDSRLIDNESFSTGIQFQNVPRPKAGMEVVAGNASDLERFSQHGDVPSELKVKAVIPGGPAQKAGLRSGDMVTKINGRPCAELKWEQVYRAFYPTSAEAGSNDPPRIHHVEFIRPGWKSPRSAAIMADEIILPETVFGVTRRSDGRWNHLLPQTETLYYARVGPLSFVPGQEPQKALASTYLEIQELLADIISQRGRGLLLDLRWCPGGFLTPAQAVTRSFLSHDEPIVKIQYRNRQDSEDHEYPVQRYDQLPLLVLVNGETMGGGELIAAALQSYHRATIAGERTFGKATVQRELRNNHLGFTYRISVGEFLTPESKKLQRYPDSKPTDDWGVRPDSGRWIPISPQLSMQLKEWWTWHSLRPAESKDALPTDDPMVDPQLKAAVQMLRQMTAKPES